MTKLNYAKTKKAGVAYGTGKIAGTKTTWTLRGKYQYKAVRDLPLNYLIWISENRQQDQHTIKANRELQRRYYKAQ